MGQYSIHKKQEMHERILSIVDTDALVLKHRAISIHSADQISTALDQFQIIMLHLPVK